MSHSKNKIAFAAKHLAAYLTTLGAAILLAAVIITIEEGFSLFLIKLIPIAFLVGAMITFIPYLFCMVIITKYKFNGWKPYVWMGVTIPFPIYGVMIFEFFKDISSGLLPYSLFGIFFFFALMIIGAFCGFLYHLIAKKFIA